MMRFICIALSAVAQAGLFSLFLGSCAAVTRDNPETYRVGDLEVRLYQDREKMVRDLPTALSLIDATRLGDTQLRILGYYDRQKRRIYSIDDARILLHELKHYLEPDWRHGIGVGRLEEIQGQVVEQDSGQCRIFAFQEEPLNPNVVTDPSLQREAIGHTGHDAKLSAFSGQDSAFE